MSEFLSSFKRRHFERVLAEHPQLMRYLPECPDFVSLLRDVKSAIGGTEVVEMPFRAGKRPFAGTDSQP